MLSIEVAVAKTHKYASRDSGDTVETVERPTGGLSVVLVDGQGSGAAAKSLSMLVSSKAVSLLKEGARDGVVARGVHDFLHAYRHGRVSATLEIVSIDLATSSLVVTRNSQIPYIVRRNGSFERRDSRTTPIGLYRHTRPSIDHYEIAEGLTVIVFSDGIVQAGERTKRPFDPVDFVTGVTQRAPMAHDVADQMLAGAMEADSGRPNDDMTVVAATIGRAEHDQPIRTLRVSLPFPG